MAHHCPALVIACLDFRFIRPIQDWLKELGLRENHDFLTVAGASKQIAQPDKEAYQEFILKQIDISVNLHQINQLFLINHEDCGAYGGQAAFKSAAAEKQKHVEDLNAAEQYLRAKYPHLQIVKVYAYLNGQLEKLYA